MTNQITLDMLDDIAAGAAFLATGGGGDPYLACLCAKEGLKAYGPATIIAPDALADDAFVIAIGGVGAPTTSLELLPSVDEAARVVEAYAEHVGRRPDALVSFEIGGANSLIPMVAAAALDIPLVDGDGMGRALPEATMMTYAIAGIAPTPAVGLDYAGNVERFDVPDVQAYEPVIRRFAIERGGMAVSAEFGMSGAELKACIVPETVSLSQRLGAYLRSDEGNAEDRELSLAKLFEGSIYGQLDLIASGLVTDYTSTVVGGYDVGQAVIESSVAGELPMKVSVKNEYLSVRQGEALIACLPDLITIVDFETGWPINAERLRFGMRVGIFRIGSPEHYSSPEGLACLKDLIAVAQS
ncbi:DUF917 domain-containing protein [uncultured Erythrobacter sp.]|uniref:DUF917 domain-containing protein n=1 Tax=uncultured Erythrobacter sp. TaxID=263913 RepID=UPI0026174160|nr:DUF917 domain-containing protein [uncultured Erythrobacter sp.]